MAYNSLVSVVTCFSPCLNFKPSARDTFFGGKVTLENFKIPVNPLAELPVANTMLLALDKTALIQVNMPRLIAAFLNR